MVQHTEEYCGNANLQLRAVGIDNFLGIDHGNAIEDKSDKSSYLWTRKILGDNKIMVTS